MSLSRATTVILTLIASLMLLSACSKTDEQSGGAEIVNPAIDSLVTAEWLQEHLNDPDLVVLDATVLIESDGSGGFRPANGIENFAAGHIPTAGFADLMGDLSDAASPLGFAVPAPEQFAAAMGALGVGDDSRVVLYDANTSSWAARVWWMLRWIGFDNAALLDGGQDAWTSAGFSLSTTAKSRPAKTLTVNLRPELIVDENAVRAAIDDDTVDIIDALTAEHFRGDFSMYGRPGHIPTALNVPVTSLVDESGRYKSLDELGTLFDTPRDKRTITYCGGGIAASGDAFVMHRLGFKDVAVYTASLQEWAADPENPMVTGSE